ncbi:MULTISPECIES: filamentous hemagglutinin N-terminal domain-containing protein [unclassified Sphingobium]|uniref:two-partner secretion domain-containing protein n=1 Tax=unclassified Sphingobium TaxID=2611147 RepID=UPI002224E247|nr:MULTISPECIES: filamentous hemagglutinin N-terminal domain-containing protein [unclassified Sphingobium]MCW2396332.1 filamentous hemagglutinin family protein [Sphingobium sp. B8D3B]MCW2419848.1 filamentous hemagglutinin family protein [Sphingobium sp. B8D3C]
MSTSTLAAQPALSPLRGRRTALLLSAAILALASARPALAQDANALPTGGVVVGGSATIGAPVSSSLAITQTSDRALIEWNSFDIGSNAQVTFSQPGASAVALNRVVGGDAPSQIAGSLNANGIVAVINSNGVMFAGTADVNVGGLIASSANVVDADFMNGGPLAFTGMQGSTAEIVVSAGANISIADQGLAAFFAPTVRNQGVISARLGRVVLASGSSATLDLDGTGFLEIGLGADNALVENSGTIAARGGQILLTARTAGALIDQVVNSGTLTASGMTSEPDGTVVLFAQSGDLAMSGTIDAGADGLAGARAAGGIDVTSALSVSGDMLVEGARIGGAGQINVADGALAMSLNVGGADVSGNGDVIGDALGVIGTVAGGTLLNLGEGIYAAGATISRDNVTINGGGLATIRLPLTGGAINGLTVNADDVTITGMRFIGTLPEGATASGFDWGNSVTRGIALLNGADNATIAGNSIIGVRNGILVDGRNVTDLRITGNLIDNTKSGISLQYVDGSASGFVISGNSAGAFGNEWGINLHLNGVWDGTTTASGNGLLGANISVDEQARLLALSGANGGMSVFNQAYTASNRTHVTVATNGSGGAQGSAATPLSSVQAGVNAVVSGGMVEVRDGTYDLGSSQLVIRKALTLTGQSESGVILDGRAVSGNGLGTISVFADNVSLSNFTLYGSTLAGGNYGIKVQPDPAGHVSTPGGTSERVHDFAISNVTVRGSRRAELDLNGVVGARITNVTADGRSVADDAILTEGAGVQITDSADVVLEGVHTLGNDWGGVALYQSNKSSGYNGQTTNITINAALNSFEEQLGLFSQLESTTQQFGQLNLTGFDYAVRNSDHRSDDLDRQFIFYRTDLADALSFARDVGNAAASSIEGYGPGGLTNIFTVAEGLSINTAIGDARSGATVNVAAGTYEETAAITKALTLSGAGMDETIITGGMTISGSPSGLTLRNFAVRGSAGSAVISNSGTITGLTLSGVRIDGENAAGRHGFIGGQIGGDIAITGSEFLNIRGWAAFDTRSGAGGANDGAQIGRVVFSGNLLDHTAGHIAFRQQSGDFDYPDVTIAQNIVRDGGDSDLSFGAIFKAFRAGTVDFVGNSVSDVGASSWTPSGEATYGAVLMMRGVEALNLTDNIFTNNNQVLAVEPGFGLPTATTITGNSFINNRYDFYLPTNVAGAGTLSFGSGNNFVAGDATVQHIVWRSANDLDLTGVSFNGVLASALTLDQLFAVEDRITHGVDVAGAGLAHVVAGQLFVTTASGPDAVRRALALGQDGDRLNLSAGTHSLTDTLFITKDIDVVGQGSGLTVIDASGHGHYGIRVNADDVALSGFALLGSHANTSSTYGIKVEKRGDADSRNTGFAITDVAISGSHKTGLDLNAVVGATIDGVSVSGVVAGNGISITDSANVVVRNSQTAGNAWGGLALYQANNIDGGGSTQQLTNITIEASNSFGESNGLYLQNSSTMTAPGAINILGYDYIVRNAEHRQDGAQFTFFQKSRQDAFDYAVNLAAANASLVQGWSGTASSGTYYVGEGQLGAGGTAMLSLQSALDGSSTGDAIFVGAGRYSEAASLSGLRALIFEGATLDGMTLGGGAAGSSIRGSVTVGQGGFTAAGLLTLSGDMVIGAPAGTISLASVDGNHGLSLSGNTVAIGSAAIGRLDATGTMLSASNIATTATQTYTGATSLSGTFSTGGGAFRVDGATTLGGATTLVTNGGAVRLGIVSGPPTLAVDAGQGPIELGSVNVGSITATGGQIMTAGAVTAGAQSYTGATTLAGTYSATSFSVNGATTLAGATTVDALTVASFLGINGSAGGGQTFTLNASTAALGNIGQITRLGATRVTGNQVVLNGSSYTASGLTFSGTANGSTLRLTQALTQFDARPGGSIAISPNLIGTANAAQSVAFLTGTGLAGATGDGDVNLGNLGSESVRLGSLSVTGGNFSAATVKLAGDFTSQLSGNQLFSANTLDTLGNVSASVTGSESGPIVAGGSVAVSAGGSGTGSIIAGGPVQLAYTSNVSRDVSSQSSVSLTSSGSVGGSIQAAGPVALSATGPVSSSVTSGGSASIASQSGISSTVNAGGGVSVLAGSGNVSGSIKATGPVTVLASAGSISSQIVTAGSASVTSGTGSISSAINAGGAVSVAAPGAVTSTISSGGTISLQSNTPLNVQVNGGALVVDAPGGTIEGVFKEISSNGDGSFVVNDQPVVAGGKINPNQIITDTFITPVGGQVTGTGEIILPVNLTLGVIAPASAAVGPARPPIVVNTVQRLGELLRQGYRAIIIQIDEGRQEVERELELASAR